MSAAPDPQPDLLVLFRATAAGTGPTTPKAKLKEQTEKAFGQYKNLVNTLTAGGLKAVGRRGEELGHLVVFVKASEKLLSTLIYAERHADVLARVPLTPQPPSPSELSSADRLRLIYTYITAVPDDGGLGIAKELPQWDCIESIMPLHDREYNDSWIRSWTTHSVSLDKIASIRKQFGTAVATYFSWLSLYTHFLYFPAALGGVFFALSRTESGSAYWTYHPLYSLLIVLWSTVWVQWWAAHEKALAITSGHGLENDLPRNAGQRSDLPVTPLNTTRPRRATFKDGAKWHHRETQVFLLGTPAVLTFIGGLAVLLTSIFLLEAFVAQLYTGPGAKVFPLIPTVLFTLLIPNFVKFSAGYLHSMTEKENHRTFSGWESSMTLKVWALNATVAYLGLFLSAFVYIPFGDGVLGLVGNKMGAKSSNSVAENIADAATSAAKNGQPASVKMGNLKSKLNPARLQNQMFAYTVTNQAVNTFFEIGLPWVMKGVEVAKAKITGGKQKNDAPGSPKKVQFEDEKHVGGEPERKWLNEIREEIHRPPYDIGTDYSEMVMQYGYVAVFSAVWPLAGVMALLNNIFELRSDAYKISTHLRRPIPTTRVESIGPWLKPLEILTWLSACVNSALVYMFWAGWEVEHTAEGDELTPHIAEALAGPVESRLDLLSKALLASLLASHGYLVLRFVVKRVVERAVLSGVRPAQRGNDIGAWNADGVADGAVSEAAEFWAQDEGEQEIARIRKEA